MTPLFYHEKQHVKYDFVSLSKIPQFVRQAKRKPVSAFEPFTVDEFKLAHHPEYVRRVYDNEITNGFGNRDREVNESLRYSNASFTAAAERAYTSGKVACSASQGFHHANFDHGWGYCTFNGLMIAAQKMLKRVNRVLIIDGDGHYGDGTEDIIGHLKLEQSIAHATRDQLGPKQYEWEAGDWEAFTRDLIERLSPGIIFYQAGADAWDKDPYNSGYLSMAGLAARDRGIFTAARDAEVPVAWNLAGGYSDPMQKVIDIHLQTLKISDEVFYE